MFYLQKAFFLVFLHQFLNGNTNLPLLFCYVSIVFNMLISNENITFCIENTR